MKVAVIIPFFQRTSGLLATALESVAAQRLDPGVTVDVVVVDDGSPVSATAERLPNWPSGFNLQIVTRRNGGVSAARNMGLDLLADDTDYVAFLDSDDRWGPAHLDVGLKALAAGADIYFSNSLDDGTINRFSYSKFIRNRHGVLDLNLPIQGSIVGGDVFETMLTDYFGHTSQAIYNFTKHRGLRFNEDLGATGEDYFFFLTLAYNSQWVSYFTGIMGERGNGVSIYRSTLSWDSPKGMRRIVDQILRCKKIIESFDLGRRHVVRLENEILQLCDHATFLGLRNFFKHPVEIISAFAILVTKHPRALKRLPRSLFNMRRYRAQLRVETE